MTSFRRPPRADRGTTAPRPDQDLGLDDLAGEILAFLAGDPDRLSRFFDLTGLAPATLRSTAAQAGFGASLFDYLASDDRLFRAFAEESGHDLASLETIRQKLASQRGVVP